MKTLSNVLNRDTDVFRIPRRVQDIIPVKTVYDDGIFRVGRYRWSKTFKFTDINYAVASYEEKEELFKAYSQFLNSFDSSANTKITIINRNVSRKNFKRDVLMRPKGDSLDEYRIEYNRNLVGQALSSNAVIQERYITVTVTRGSVDEARTYFNRVQTDMASYLNKMGSMLTPIDALDKLEVFHMFYQETDEQFNLDIKSHRKAGDDFKDYICPDCFELARDHFRMGDKYGRVLFLKDYAAFIKDNLVSELTGLNRNMIISIDVVPVPMDEAIREADRRLLGVETNIANWQRRQNQNNNFSAVVPYDLEQQRRESKEFLDDLTTRDQRMMLSLLTIVLTADTKEQLDEDTEAVKTIGRQHMCQIATLKWQQLDGLNTAMPFGVCKIQALRTLTTEALAVLMPFNVQEVHHKHGIYYGQNIISKNMILADRRQLLNGNSFILGVSGSGKSFAAKSEITNLMLSCKADIIVIDPEREYAPLVRALGGEVIEISATSENHINAMDLNREYSDVDPVIEKSQFLQSLCEQIIAGHHFTKGQQSIIDRCAERVYRPYISRGYKGQVPTLKDFYEELLIQPEPEAKSLALELEIFAKGTLNTFAKETNVDTKNRLICYDILELGEQLRGVGMLVILDSILNRISMNRRKGKETFIFIDEIYLLFLHEYSAQFLFKLWKRVRKYGAYCTGITQNVEDLLQSHTARTMLSNSEFLIMLNQASSDQFELAKLLNISDQQLSHITNVDAGHGLLKVGSSLVPFENSFPKRTKLYQLMTTKPGERKKEKHGGHKNKRKIQED